MGTMTAKVRFVGDAKQLLRTLSNTDKMFAKVGGTVERMSSTFVTAGTAMAGSLVGLTTQGIAYGTTIDRISKTTGVAAEEISGLAYSVELLHGDTGMLEKGLRQLAQRMGYARDGLETYTREFERADIEYKNADGSLRSVTEVYLDLADAVALNADGSEVLANVMQLLGGRQSTLTGHLKQGREEIGEDIARARELGLVLDNETAEAMERAGTSIKDLKLAARGLGGTLATALAPSIDDASESITDIAIKFHGMSSGAQEAHLKTAALGAGGLLAVGQIGRLGGILGSTATGPLALFTAGIIGSRIAIEQGKAGLYEQIAAVRLLKEDTDALATAQLEQAEASLRNAAGWQLIKEHALKLDLNWFMENLFDDGGSINPFENFAANMEYDIDELLDSMTADLAEAAATSAERAAQIRDDIAAALAGAGGGGDVDLSASIKFPTSERFLESLPGPDDWQGAMPNPEHIIAPMVSGMTDSFLPAIDLGINKVQEFGYMLAKEFSDNAPQLIGNLIGTVDNAMGKLVEIQGKFGKTMLKATKDYLVSFLDMVLKTKTQELMMEMVTEQGKIVMSALMNPANLLKLGGLSAAYAGASAALHAASNASFREGGVVTQSGQYTGLFHAGDAIVGPDAMKAMLSGKGGGGTNIEAHIHVHGDLAMSQGELTDTLDGFANRLAFQMGRA